MITNKITKSIRLTLAFGIASSITLAPTIAAAAEEVAEEVERVIITGSRLLREGDIAPSPVTVLSGEQLLSTGALNIGEALNRLPSLKPTFGLANSGRFIGTAGLNSVDLRGMGSARTLVLVDGKRHVSSSESSARVDTNTIPTAWIDRVEIITGGASAVYGADAVTGVVNFILKKEIEGFDFSATKGYADNSSFDKQKLSLSYGRNFDNDRGNFAISFEYAGQDRLNALDNKFTKDSVRSLTNPAQNDSNRDDPNVPDKILTTNASIYGLTPEGSFNLGGWHTFNGDGSLRPIYTGDWVDGISCHNCDGMNLRMFNEIQPKFDRYAVNAKANYDLNDDTNVYLEVKHVTTESIDYGQPYYWGFGRALTLHNDNPFLHQSVLDHMTANDAESIRINRFATNTGRRFEDNTRETNRLVTGITGVLFEDWDYEAFANIGQTKITRENNNNIVLAKYLNAVDAIRGSNGDIVCRDEAARADGCAPLDVAGFGRGSQAASDYINVVSVGKATLDQINFGASIANADLYELPAGSVGFVVGLEYRKEKSENTEDENAVGTAFNQLGEDKGEYDVSEIFAELSLPLLADLPGVDSLVLDIAARHSDYSTIGGATTWKLGLDWSIYEDLRFRSTLSEAIRAPDIGDTFGAASQSFFNVKDPCRVKSLNERTAEARALREQSCAALGVPAGFDSQYDDGRLPGVQGGNKELTEEKSNSITAGVVFTPSFVDGLSITADYWKIELTDAIAAVGAQAILDRCVDAASTDNSYCPLFDRDPNTHEITEIRRFSLNIASQEASGVDIEINYNFETSFGDFSTRLMGTHLFERKRFPFQDEPERYEEYAGVDSEAKWQLNGALIYSYDNWVANWDLRFVDRVSAYRDDELETNPNPLNYLEWSSYVTNDASVTYAFDSGVKIKLGIDNIFNKRPPALQTGTTEQSGNFDNLGRFGHATISFSF